MRQRVSSTRQKYLGRPLRLKLIKNAQVRSLSVKSYFKLSKEDNQITAIAKIPNYILPAANPFR